MSSTPTVPQLEVTPRPDRSRVVVELAGELDLATVGRVEEEVVDLCERGFPEVCLDLRGLTFCDSSGVRLLVRLDRRLADRGCRLTVDARRGAAVRVLRLLGVERRLHAAVAR